MSRYNFNPHNHPSRGQGEAERRVPRYAAPKYGLKPNGGIAQLTFLAVCEHHAKHQA